MTQTSSQENTWYGGFIVSPSKWVSASLINDGIEPSHREEDKNKASFSDMAFKAVEKLYRNNPIGHDLFPYVDAINAWPFVTSAYQGIEQATKMLIEMSGGQVPQTAGQGGHHLNLLFGKLTGPEKNLVRKSYAVYQSLHNYIPQRGVDGFLQSINSGYDAWRYLILNAGQNTRETGAPPTHIGAMLEIWRTLNSILIAKTFTDHGLLTVVDRIAFVIGRLVEKSGHDQPHRLDDAHVREFRSWLRIEGGIINAYADFVRSSGQGESLPLMQHNINLLNDSLRYAERETDNTDLVQFLSMVRENGLRWNHNREVFHSLQPD